ncbi:MAG: hypothetical protein AAFN10_28290, partial [Bacteroidota bacterium]
MSQDKVSLFISNYIQGLKLLQVTEESIARIQKTIKTQKIKSKDTLIIPGDVCQHVYVIVQGGFVCR